MGTLKKYMILKENHLVNIYGGGAEHIGTNLLTLRITSGVTKYEIAEELHVDPTSITRYENGSRVPDIDTLIKFSKLFKTSVENIIYE
ncbi:helix-turn-helix domain-containing protein [Leuconostoc miyukkimchii]|uniref:helix-turn-helix domain-containing protein n=1 Tax=Leuconostoc miyukkimchii TaxID=910540 RepID=UPI001C7CEA36|nr:helix-turn-helix transcriptional regulator [Leuconostoc miyukkimchii]